MPQNDSHLLLTDGWIITKSIIKKMSVLLNRLSYKARQTDLKSSGRAAQTTYSFLKLKSTFKFWAIFGDLFIIRKAPNFK